MEGQSYAEKSTLRTAAIAGSAASDETRCQIEGIPFANAYIQTVLARDLRGIMARINRTQVVLQAQVRFGEVLDYYVNEFVHNPEKLSASTREKYENHIENHIRPAWQDRMLGEFRALEVEKWLTEKGKPRIVERSGKQKLIAGLSWNTRTDLRNIVSGIFTKSIEWGIWKGEPRHTR